MSDIAFFYPKDHELHYQEGHPERPDRVEAIRDALAVNQLWDKDIQIEKDELPLAAIQRVHTQEYLDHLRTVCNSAGNLDPDTYTTNASWDLALQAAGGGIATALSVWRGESKTGFALTRPPGHHASRNQGMGFCLINNIAVAADYLLNLKESYRAERIAIVDLDLHHGNGTEEIFWSRNDVFYFSIHQSPLYPGTGKIEEIGNKAGEGYTLNLPFPPGTGDTGYITAVEEVIIPILDRFMPNIILVSYGFDPHWLDPLGHQLLTAEGYHKLILALKHWTDNNCGGKVVLFLEGGYDLNAAAVCSVGVVTALLGHPFIDSLGQSSRKDGQSWRKVIKNVKSFWGI